MAWEQADGSPRKQARMGLGGFATASRGEAELTFFQRGVKSML